MSTIPEGELEFRDPDRGGGDQRRVRAPAL